MFNPKRQDGASGITTVLAHSVGDSFYARTVYFYQTKLRQASLSISRKLIFVSLILLCSKVNLSLNAPLPRSIRLYPYYNVSFITTLSERKAPLPFIKSTTLALLFSYAPGNKAHFAERLAVLVDILANTTLSSLGPLQYLQFDDRGVPTLLVKLSLFLPQGPPAYILQNSLNLPTLFPFQNALATIKNLSYLNNRKSRCLPLFFC